MDSNHRLISDVNPAETDADSRLESVAVRFGDLVKLVDRLLEKGRPTAQGSRAAQEPCFSLARALACVPGELGIPAAIRFCVMVEGSQRELRGPLWQDVYSIAREAIVNAYRHSMATEVVAEIEYLPAGLRVLVRDDGCGIDPQQTHWCRNGNRGVQKMRARAERIGARLRILSRVAMGTEVELCVPGAIAFERDDVEAA